jgi:2-succinyl-5-enolpyruvyl-6-hydroxy-3-cyclohexene-1-carboxylate synthase
MFSNKKNILQTVALLKEYGVKHIVISPGSRNAPLIQTFTQDSFFICQLVVDERNAAFFALGIIQYTRQAAVVCCTSGSALLNCAPAVVEAYYQQLPLIVISADRPQEWIGQMDGQTMLQPNVFASYIRKSVHLPEVYDESNEWYCNRLVNEALIACSSDISGPVHINIPISEPLFNYTVENLPEVRKISYSKPNKTVDIVDMKPYADRWNAVSKKMIIAGQMFQNPVLAEALERLTESSGCIILSEHLANSNSGEFIHNFDRILYKSKEKDKKELSPELLISFGGHIASKRIKRFLRENPPESHWYLSNRNEVTDLFMSLTDLIETDILDFIQQLANSSNLTKESYNYSNSWFYKSAQIAEPEDEKDFTDIAVTGLFLKRLPENSQLIVANSSAVRNVQFFNLDRSINIYCNRGINGLEGTLATAVGFAFACKTPVYLIIGDLSFFYGINSLWNMEHVKNLRILLINNKGGGIFRSTPELNKPENLNQFVTASHDLEAEKWFEAISVKYLQAKNKKQLLKSLDMFMNEKIEASMCLEVVTEIKNH